MTQIQQFKNPLLGSHVDMRHNIKFGESADPVAKWTILATDTTDATLIPYVKGGSTAGNGIPSAIAMEAAAGDDENVRTLVMTAGYIDRSALIIAADGNATNVDSTVISLLSQRGIYVIDPVEHSIPDNS